MANKPQPNDNKCYLEPKKSNDKENTMKDTDCDSVNEQYSNFRPTASNDATRRSFKAETERWSTAEDIYLAENNYYIHPEESPIENEPVLIKAKIKPFDTSASSPLYRFLVTPNDRSLLIRFLKNMRCSQYSSSSKTPEFLKKLTTETLRPLFDILNSAELERFIKSPNSNLENVMVNPTKPEYVSRITQLMVLVKPGNLKELLTKFFLNFVYHFPRFPYLLFKSKLNPSLEKTDYYIPFQALLPEYNNYTPSQIDKDFLEIIDITLGTDVSVKNVTTRLIHFLSTFRTYFIKFIKDLRTERNIPNSNSIFSSEFSTFHAIGKKRYKDLKAIKLPKLSRSKDFKSIKLRKLSRETVDTIRSRMSFKYKHGSTSNGSSEEVCMYTPVYAKRDFSNERGIFTGYTFKNNSFENIMYQGNLSEDEDLFTKPRSTNSWATGYLDEKVNSSSNVTVSPCNLFGENENSANAVFANENILENEREEEAPFYAVTYDTKNNLVHHYENFISLYDNHTYDEIKPATGSTVVNYQNIDLTSNSDPYRLPGVPADEHLLSRPERIFAIRKRLRRNPIYMNVGEGRLEVIIEKSEEEEEEDASSTSNNDSMDINSTLKELERLKEACQQMLVDNILTGVSEPRRVGPLFSLCPQEFIESQPVKKDNLLEYLDSGNSSFLGLGDLFQTVSLSEESGPPSPNLNLD